MQVINAKNYSQMWPIYIQGVLHSVSRNKFDRIFADFLSRSIKDVEFKDPGAKEKLDKAYAKFGYLYGCGTTHEGDIVVLDWAVDMIASDIKINRKSTSDGFSESPQARA